MSSENIAGVDVNAVISGLAGENAGTGVIGGYCEDGFPLFYANEAMVKMLGYESLEDLTQGISGMVANTIHPEDMAQVTADLGNDWREGQTYETQYRMPRKDGSWFWTVDRGEFVRAEDGRLAILSVCSDMTDFMRRHDELEKKTELTESMLASLPGGYHRCAADADYTFLYVGQRFLDILGWTEEELRTKFDNKFINLVHPDDQDITDNYVQRIDASEGDGLQDQVYRLAAKDGGWRWVTDATMKLTVEGKTFYQGFITDITGFMTERDEREGRLRAIAREAKEKSAELSTMHAIIEAAEMGTWRIDLVEGEPGRMYADRRMFELLGLSEQGASMTPEEVYDAWFSRIKPEAVQGVLDSVARMQAGNRDENTYLWVHPTLGERYVRCGGTAIEIEGGYEMRGYHYDVDDIVREQAKQDELLKDALAAAEHANRAKTTFLNNMSHDIRTPMNAIIGYTALAASHIDNTAQVKDYLSKITTSSSHLLALINDVLDMSRIESGKVNINEKETSLPEVMHDIRSISQASVSAKQLDFFIDTVDVAHEDVICDKLRLQQVLINILGNAVKFTEPGGSVSLRVIEKPSKSAEFARYEFRIKDTGIGMSKEFQEHIFEPFTREQSSTVSGIPGTGLGMAITKNIVDMMGGEIRVRSTPNVGTEFVVSLDCRIAGNPVRYERIDELQGIRALVADDDSDTAVSVSNMLRSIGLRSDWTLSGKEAVLRAKVAVQEADEYGVYVIDWMMPDMNGIETVRQIRRQIGNESVPIIVLTAYDWVDIEAEARAAGVTAFVSKPIFMSELREVLSEPFRAADDEGETEAEAAAPAADDVAGTKVLLVEDNVMNQEIAEAILTEHGILVDVVDDGDVAVKVVAQSPAGTYDLVLMDIQMPRMNGYEATRAIRALEDPELANIPIIAMTANAFEEDKALAKKAGMDGYITKPIDIDKTIEAIHNYAKR